MKVGLIQHRQRVFLPDDSISKIFDILHILFRAYLICAHIMCKDVPDFTQSAQLPIIPLPIGDYALSLGRMAFHTLKVLTYSIHTGIHIRTQALQMLIFLKKLVI